MVFKNEEDKREALEGTQPEDLIEPGQTEEFNYAKFQELNPDDVPCDVPEEVDEVLVCPSCVPNPDWTPDFNWKLDPIDNFANIYLDEATCEYVMITEEAVSDVSEFRNLGLSTIGVMIGDESIHTTPEDGRKNRGNSLRNPRGGQSAGSVMDKLDDVGLVSYNDTGCTDEDTSEDEYSKKFGACKTWHSRIDAYKAHAVREIMFHYGKEVNDTTYIAMYDIASPDGFYEDGHDWYLDPTRRKSSLVRVRVAIPAQLFDNLPDAAPEDSTDVKSPVNSVVLKSYDINKKVDRLRKAFKIYGRYQAYWFHSDGARLFIDYGDGSVQPMYLDSEDGANQRDRLEAFVDRLQDFVDEAGYKFGEGLAGAFRRDTLAYEVKLEFDEKMKISAVYARKSGCDFEILGGIKGNGTYRHLNKSAFKKLRKKTGRSVGYYLAKIHDIDHDLRAREPMPWLDFIKIYTYPNLKVDYGAGLPQQSVLGCFLSNEGYGQFFDCVLDQLISLPDVIAYKFEEFGCELIDEQQKQLAESAEAIYKAKQEMRQAATKKLAEFDKTVEDAKNSLEKAKEIGDEDFIAAAEQGLEFRENNRATYKTNTSKKDRERARQEFRKARKRINNEAQDKLLANANDALADAGFGPVDSRTNRKDQAVDSYRSVVDFLTSDNLAEEAKKVKDWKKLPCGVYPRDGDLLDQALPKWMQGILLGPGKGGKRIKKLYKNILSRLTFCGILGLMQAGLECIFAGLSFMDAMMILIKAAFKDMPPYSLGKLFIGLPVDKQLEIEEKVRKQLKELNISAVVDMQAVMGQASQIVGEATKATEEELQTDYQSELNALDPEDPEFEDKADALTSRIEQGNEYLQAANQSVQDSLAKTMDPANASGVDSYGNPTGGGGQSSDKVLGKTTGDIVAPILKAYVDAIIDVYKDNPEQLLEEFNRIPGAALLARTLLLSRCPRKPLFYPPIFDFMKGLDFKFCTNGKVPAMPVLRPIDWVTWKALLKYLVDMAIEEIRDLAEKLLVAIIIKILQSVYNAICKLIQTGVNIAATAVSNAIKGESTNVYQLLVESFCGPDPSQEQVAGVLTEIFQASGVSINPPDGAPGSGDYIGQQSLVDGQYESYANASNDVVDYFQDVFGELNQREALDLMSGNATQDTIQAAANLARLSPNPVIRDSMSDADILGDTFRNIATLIPAEATAQLESIQRQLDEADLELPLNSTFCASDREVEEFYEGLKTNLTGGDRDVSPQQAENLAAAHQEEQIRLGQELADLMSGPLINPEDIPDIFSTPDPTDPCATNGNDGKGALLPREPAEITALANESYSKIFDAIEAQYTEDLVGTKGIFNYILSDSIGVGYLDHMRKVNRRQDYVNSRKEVEIYLDLVNSIDDKDTREAATTKIFGEKKINKREAKKLLDKSTGYLPKTVGLHLRKIFDNFSPADSSMTVLGEEVKTPQGVDVEVKLTTEVTPTKFLTNEDKNDVDTLRERNINIFTNKYSKRYIENNRRFIESAISTSNLGKYSLAEESICAQVSSQLEEAADSKSDAEERAGNPGYIFNTKKQAEDAHDDLKDFEIIQLDPSRKKADLKLTFKDRNFENSFTKKEKNGCPWAVKFKFETALFDAINDENGDVQILDPGRDGDIGQITVKITTDSRAEASDEVDDLYDNKKSKKQKDKEARMGPFVVDQFSTNKFLCVHSQEVNDVLNDLNIIDKAPTKPPMHTTFCAMLEESIKSYNNGEEVVGIDYDSLSSAFFREEDYSSLLTSTLNGFMKPLGKKNKNVWKFGFDPGKAIIDPRAFQFGVVNSKPGGDEEDYTSYDKYRQEWYENRSDWGTFRPMHRAERKAKVLPISRYEHDKGKPHPRVHILDPAEHGGSYDNPPIYIEPYVRDGWLGLLDKLMPEWDGCKPRKADLINLDDIKDRVNNLNQRLPDDPRLQFDEGCLVEEPYARILNRFSAAAIEGAVRTIIRLVISENFINGISAFTTFKMSNDNFDEGFAAFILSNIEFAVKEKSDRSGFLFGGGGLDGDEYYYAFLEMCVQIWNRQYSVLGEIPEEEVSDQLLDALEQLNEILEAYANPRTVHQTDRNDIWPRNRHHLKAAKDRGEIGFFGTLKRLRKERNLSIVAKTEYLASIFAMELIKQEMEFFSKKVEDVMGIDFKFNNMTEYFLDNLCVGSSESYDQLLDVAGKADSYHLNWFESQSEFASKYYEYDTVVSTTTDPGTGVSATETTYERTTATKEGSTITNPFQPLYDKYYGAIFTTEDEIAELEPYAEELRDTIEGLEEDLDDKRVEKTTYISEQKAKPITEGGLLYLSDEEQNRRLKEDPTIKEFEEQIAEFKLALEEPTRELDDLEDKISDKEDTISNNKTAIKELLEKIQQGGFAVQRFAVVKDRSEILAENGQTELPGQFNVELPDYVLNRGAEFRGLVSMESFKDYFSNMPDEIKEITERDGTVRPAKFSDYFSTFEYVYEVSLLNLVDAGARIPAIEAFLNREIDFDSEETIAIPFRLIPSELFEGEPEPTGLTGDMGIEFGMRTVYFPSEARGEEAYNLLVGKSIKSKGIPPNFGAPDATGGSGVMANYPEMIAKAQKEYALSVVPFYTREFYDRGLDADGTEPPEGWEHRNVFENTNERKHYINTICMIPMDEVRRDLIDTDIEAPSVEVLASAGLEQLQIDQDLISEIEQLNAAAQEEADRETVTEITEQEYYAGIIEQLSSTWETEGSTERYEAKLRGYGSIEGIYDFKCLRDEFSKKASMKVVTEYVLKLKRLTSMAAIYNSVAFPWSILQVSGSPSQVAKGKKELIKKYDNFKKSDWKRYTYGFFGIRGIFTDKFEKRGLKFIQGENPYRKSLRTSKSLFISLYNDRDFTDPDDNGAGSSKSFKEALRRMFGPNLDQSMKWWNRTRRRPFDANGEDCKTKLL
tara:strand:- start:9960 stop:18674 length:8715 start_codon:yes stop_codon:yes gene_type:complete